MPQITIKSGSNINIAQNACLKLSGLKIHPNTTYTLAENKSLSKNSTSVNVGGGLNSIKKYYSFDSQLDNFTGDITIDYINDEMNAGQTHDLSMYINSQGSEYIEYPIPTPIDNSKTITITNPINIKNITLAPPREPVYNDCTEINIPDYSGGYPLTNNKVSNYLNSLKTSDITAYTRCVLNNVYGTETEVGNNYTVTETTITATRLNELDGQYSGTVDASSVTTITGLIADINTAYASSGILGLGDEAITMDDTTVNAADLNTLDDNTTGAIHASSVETITGTIAAVTTVYESSGITGLGDEAIIISDTTVDAVSEDIFIGGNTTGVIDASSVQTIIGTIAAVTTVYESSGITGLGNAEIVITSPASVANLNSLDGVTNGDIIATVSDTDVATLKTLTGTNNVYDITISDTTVTARDLNIVDHNTTGAINASSVTIIAGLTVDIITAYASSGISGLGDEAITISDTTVTARDLNTLDNTTGAIHASSVETITGLIADINIAYASSGISGLGDEAITLSDSTVSASSLNTLDTSTTGSINASSVTTITGSIADINTAYASSASPGLGNEAITISDTTVTARDLNIVDDNTTGAIHASSVTTITGTISAVSTAYASNSITGLGDETIIITSPASVANLNSLDGMTNGDIIATVSDTDVATLKTLTGTNNVYDITISDTTVNADDLIYLDYKTTGTVDASSVQTITGTIAAVTTVYPSTGITGLGDETIIISDTVSNINNAANVANVSNDALRFRALYSATKIIVTDYSLGDDLTSIDVTSGSAAQTAATGISFTITFNGNLSIILSADITINGTDAALIKTVKEVQVSGNNTTITFTDCFNTEGDPWTNLGSIVVTNLLHTCNLVFNSQNVGSIQQLKNIQTLPYRNNINSVTIDGTAGADIIRISPAFLGLGYKLTVDFKADSEVDKFYFDIDATRAVGETASSVSGINLNNFDASEDVLGFFLIRESMMAIDNIKKTSNGVDGVVNIINDRIAVEDDFRLRSSSSDTVGEVKGLVAEAIGGVGQAANNLILLNYENLYENDAGPPTQIANYYYVDLSETGPTSDLKDYHQFRVIKLAKLSNVSSNAIEIAVSTLPAAVA